MKKWIILPVLLLLFACKEKLPESYFTAEKALSYFKKVEDACNKDNGKLWGKNLYGPILFIDRETRRITANSGDDEGLLKLKDGVYTGTFPKEMIISNRAIKFGGKLFAIAPLPLEEDEYTIINRAIHGLFHRFQEISGFTYSGNVASNMDEKNARIWIKCEWHALKKALSTHGEEQNVAIRDALVFRGANHELYQRNVSDEIKYETYEGLATFTCIFMASKTQEEFSRRLIDNLNRIYRVQSFSRTYGTIHGALYTTLLYRNGFDLSTIRSENTDLGELVRKSYNIELPEVCRDIAGSLALNYDLDSIRIEEAEREKDIRARIQSRTSIFTEKPVVFFELESPYFDFEPENVQSADTLGTIYKKLRVSDNWGKLSVDKGGCLIANNLRFLRVTAKGFKVDKDRISGEGWSLILNNDWEIIQANQNYIVRRIMP
jgi:hypothetical protein